MPPAKYNPAAGKQPANARWKSHTRNGKRVRGHTRSVNMTRISRTWVGAAASGAVCVGILVEAGFTVASTVGVVVIAAATALAVFAGEYVEKNRPKMQEQAKARAQARKRKPRPRTTTRRKPAPRKRR